MLTTLCYIEQDGKYLMLLRNRKKKDPNENKWIGVGGKFLPDESPEECLLREVREETGLSLTNYRFRGIITFKQNDGETEYMHLFTATDYTGTLQACDEGELQWIPKEEIMDLNLWEGDRIFLDYLLRDIPLFSATLRYEGDRLVYKEARRYDLNGQMEDL